MKNITSKKSIAILSLLVVAGTSFGQEMAEAIAESTAPESPMVWMYHNMFAVLAIVAIIGAFGAMLYMSKMLFDLQKMRLLQDLGMEAMEEVKLLDAKPWYQRLNEKLWALKPMEREAELDLDHDYDGIRELDNVLPPWWVATFYITIVFGVFYIGYAHFSDYGKSSAEQYEIEVAEAEKAVKAYLASQSDLVDETNATLLTDESELMLGASLFQTNCVLCHGPEGQGNATGPNLTDEYWLHGGGIKNVFSTIKYGVPEKGMIPWKTQLRSSDIHRVASYILSLQGTNPSDPKAPQGELWKEDLEESQDADADEKDKLSMN